MDSKQTIFLKSLGKYLQGIRKEKGLSVLKIYTKLKDEGHTITREQIQHIEAGSRAYTTPVLLSYLEGLGVYIFFLPKPTDAWQADSEAMIKELQQYEEWKKSK